MVNPPLSNGYFYHIYNRGVEKRKIFLGKKDYLRFLETLDYYRKTPQPMKLSDFRRGVIKYKQTNTQTESVKILSYCLMPNHFHLLIQQLQENGISHFLRKTSDSYTKFFNTKYDRVGSLFQGTFKAKLIQNDEYLLQVSKYIHKNSFPLKEWEGKIYPYSSYDFYLSGEIHSFCDKDFILSYFSKTNAQLNYQAFVEESEIDDSAITPLLIDYEK